MKMLTTAPNSSADNKLYLKDTTKWQWKIVLCLFIFTLCIGIGVAPLQRWANVPAIAQIPISRLLTLVGAWLPSEFSLLRGVQDSIITTSNGEVLLLVAFAFVLYGLCAWLIYCNAKSKVNMTRLLSIIAITIIIVGLVFVFTPALLSHDIFAYADYGRAILVHHSNPYFVPPAIASPHDPITQLDEWSHAGTAYGPLWFYVCLSLALLSGADPLHYIFAFRVLGLCAHLLNTLLIVCVVREAGRSPRMVVLGVLLYGLNPLALLESCLDAHNDVLMGTFMLLGIWLALRVEGKKVTCLKAYIPPLLALTMATLIKFTAAPLLLFYIFLLFRKMFQASETGIHGFSQKVVSRWVPSILNACIASLICGLVALLFYAPFWVGHSISAITQSFSTPPSSYSAENSLLRVFIERVKLYGFPPRSSWKYELVHLLIRYDTWHTINVAVLVVTLLAGFILLWHSPTIQNMVFATLIVFESVLLVTPWFYAWYVLWIIPLAVVLLAGFDAYRSRTFTLFAFVFSASAFFTYIMPYYLHPFDSWQGTRYTLANGLPLLVLLVFLSARVFYGKRSIA